MIKLHDIRHSLIAFAAAFTLSSVTILGTVGPVEGVTATTGQPSDANAQQAA